MKPHTSPAHTWVTWLGGCSRPKSQLQLDCVHPFLEQFNEHFNPDFDNNQYKEAVREALDAVQSGSMCQPNPVFEETPAESPTVIIRSTSVIKQHKEHASRPNLIHLMDKENVPNCNATTRRML